jgi:transposase
MRDLFEELYQEILSTENKIKKYDTQLGEIARQNEVCQRIREIEGIGPITSTAVVAAIADASVFSNGRQLAAWLGLVPKQHSSGGKNVLLRISKRGNRYLRTLLVHGARSVLKAASKKKDERSQWLIKKKESKGFNKTCVALANRNARVIWALMKTGASYQPKHNLAARCATAGL